MNRFNRVRVVSLAIFLAVTAIGSIAVPSQAAAQDFSELARIVRSGRDFRARVRAAFALGASPSHRRVLERALRDDNPAVRSAAATALRRVADPRSLRALRRARRDESVSVRLAVERTIQSLSSEPPGAPARSRADRPAPVRWPTVRYVIVLGTLRDASGHVSDANLTGFRDALRDSLSRIDHVAVVDEIDERVRERIEEHGLVSYRLDGVIEEMTLEDGRDRLARARVALLLVGDGESLKGTLTGAAGSGESRRGAADAQHERLCGRAITGAVRSATADAYSALQAADVSRTSVARTQRRTRRRRRQR